MIQFDKHTPRWYKDGRYHKGFTIKITIYPGLIIPSILEQIRKGLKYPNAVTLVDPYWNGKDWEEGKDLDDIPF